MLSKRLEADVQEPTLYNTSDSMLPRYEECVCHVLVVVFPGAFFKA